MDSLAFWRGEMRRRPCSSSLYCLGFSRSMHTKFLGEGLLNACNATHRSLAEEVGYGGRLVSKLHSDAFAILEHVLFSFEYAFFIRVWSLHLGMLFSFRYGLCIWVCSLHLSVLFSFWYGIFIWIYSFHLGMVFLYGYILAYAFV